MGEKLIRLGDRELRCIEVMPLGMVFDLAEAMDVVIGESAPMKQTAALSRFLKKIVVAEDLPKLQEVLHDTVTAVTFGDLNEAVGSLMVEYSGRPFAQRRSSSPGPTSTGGSSRVVSLWRGTGKTPARSSKPGRSGAA